MEDIISAGVKVLAIALGIGLLYALVKIVNGTGNTLEWWHLVSSRSSNGVQFADWNKIGQGCGVVLCTVLPAVYVYSPKMDAIGLAAVMGVALLYLGGVSGYAANLRSKQGTRETVTEPAAVPGPVKTTVLENPPLVDKP